MWGRIRCRFVARNSKSDAADIRKLFAIGSGDHILEDVAVKERELFISDATDVYPASALR